MLMHAHYQGCADEESALLHKIPCHMYLTCMCAAGLEPDIQAQQAWTAVTSCSTACTAYAPAA